MQSSLASSFSATAPAPTPAPTPAPPLRALLRLDLAPGAAASRRTPRLADELASSTSVSLPGHELGLGAGCLVRGRFGSVGGRRCTALSLDIGTSGRTSTP